jgi:colanic acid/amylovoran biosynthesis protein
MKIALFFHGGSKNRGCEAIVRSAVNLISATYPTALINLISFDPESDMEIPTIATVFDGRAVAVRKNTFTGFIAAVLYKLFQNETLFLRIKHQKIIQLIPTHDVFLSVGGDNYCYGEQPWLYEIDRLIKKAGKKLILWGASIGLEDLSEMKLKDLHSFDVLLARESLTYEVLKSKGLQQVQLVADGAFLLEKELLLLPMGWKEGATIGFNFSPLVWNLNPASKAAAFDLVRHLLSTTDFTIALLPHVIIPDNDDYAVLSEFYAAFKATGRVLLLPNDLNAIQYKGYISRMRFFIGARTHATIAAYSCLVPTLVLGYSIKSKGIALDIFGEEKLVLGIDELSDSARLIAKWDEMVRDEDAIRILLAHRIPEIQGMARKAGGVLGMV